MFSLRPVLAVSSALLLTAGALLGTTAVSANADATDVVDAPVLDYVPDPDVPGVTDVADVDKAVSPASEFTSLEASLRCDPETFWQVTGGQNPTYKSWGPAAGKYNASNRTDTLQYSIKTSTSRSTTIEVGGTVSVDTSIVQIEAMTKYSVTKQAATEVTVTDTLSVPSHYYGYDQPKVEYRTFVVQHIRRGANCHETVLADSTVYALTAVPFWSSCIGTKPCTPKP